MLFLNVVEGKMEAKLVFKWIELQASNNSYIILCNTVAMIQSFDKDLALQKPSPESFTREDA